METKDERYFLGEKVAVDVVSTPDKESPMMKGFGVVFMSGEKKTPGAKPGSDEEYTHKVLECVEFKDKENLELFQMGAKLMQKALFNEGD